MDVIHVAIADDEPIARMRLSRLLGKVGGRSITVTAECVDADDLLSSAGSVPIDVVFLDIEMPGGGGFGALAKWPGTRPVVVCVSACTDYGAAAFDIRAIDFLTKPVSAERLSESIARVRRVLGHRETLVQVDSAARIPLQIGRRTHLVRHDAITAVVARRSYLEVHTEAATFLSRRTLSAFQADINMSEFVRLHRSVIVGRDAIVAIRPKGAGCYELQLKCGREVSSGRSYHAVVKALLRP